MVDGVGFFISSPKSLNLKMGLFSQMSSIIHFILTAVFINIATCSIVVMCCVSIEYDRVHNVIFRSLKKIIWP